MGVRAYRNLNTAKSLYLCALTLHNRCQFVYVVCASEKIYRVFSESL